MLIDTLKKENMLALKAKDENKRAVLSVIINKYMIAGYEAKAKGQEIGDIELISIINKTLRELEDEKAGYLTANRPEQVKELELQIAAVEQYKPKMMSEEDIKKEILSLEDKALPVVMKHFKMNFAGKVNMADVSKVLKTLSE